jgi:hypothetical protein
MPFIPFYTKFQDIAEEETRSLIIHGDPELPDDTYTLIELYCDEKNCDCRRVFFDVLSENTKKVLAVVAYGWERRQYYIDWIGDSSPGIIDALVGPGLNLGSPQSEFAQALLKKIDIILKNDIPYVERFKKHYMMFRMAVDKSNKPTPFVSQVKIGRNDPCPCGSGRKYKKCCLN